jgi:hypothetical protein
MTTEAYKVEAGLEIGAQTAVAGVDAVVKKLRGLQGGLKGAKEKAEEIAKPIDRFNDKLRSANEWVKRNRFGIDGLVTRALALGAAYFGINRLVEGFKSLSLGILSANADAESMKASLATVYAAVEKVSFKDAVNDADSLFRVLQTVAIKSTATTEQLMEVFQGIYGPLRRAGLTLDQIVETTNNAAVASSALGVDYAQASRDISAMARGTAGLDVKTFSLLQSMGLIKETTQQWNALAPDKRAKRLMDVMNKIGGQAAEAYGRTWKGLSSTFVDIMSSFKRTFGSAVFERMKNTLEKINNYLLANRQRIEEYLSVLGERVGTVFDNVVNKGGAAFHAVIDNIDSIHARIASLYARFEALKPLIAEGAKVGLGMQVAAMAFNTIAPVFSALISAMSWLVTSVGAAGGFGAAISAAMSSISAFGAMLAPLLVPLALIGVAIVALVAGAIHYSSMLGAMLKPLGETIRSIFGQVFGMVRDVWVAVEPVLAFIGGVVIAGLIMAVRMFAGYIDDWVLPKFRMMVRILRWAFEEVIHPLIKDVLEPALRLAVEAFEWLADKVNAVVDAFSDMIQWIEDKLDSLNPFSGSDTYTVDDIVGQANLNNAIDAMQSNQAAWAAAKKAQEAAMREAARIAKEKHDKEVLGRERTTTNVDMRGSKITVNQSFKEADPDNVWVQMRDGLEQEAVTRSRSGYADALSR